jgi:hypothetical protein
MIRRSIGAVSSQFLGLTAVVGEVGPHRLLQCFSHTGATLPFGRHRNVTWRALRVCLGVLRSRYMNWTCAARQLVDGTTQQKRVRG